MTMHSAQSPSIDRRLWTALLLGPLAAASNTIVGYTVSHYACETREKMALFAVMVVDLAICAVGVLIARSAQKKITQTASAPLPDERRVFMLQMAVALCAFCALLTLAGTFAVIILQPCD